MSGTDDTDDLLLIPPDLFVLDSEREDSLFNKRYHAPYYGVVDCLIQQVSKLENRVNSIESASDISLISNSCDNTPHVPGNTINLMSEERRFNSSDDVQNLNENLYFESTQSTPQKPKTKQQLNSLPNTPKARYSLRKRTKAFVGKESKFQKPPSIRTCSVESCQHDGSGERKGSMLREIDHFISNVKTIKRINATRNIFPEVEHRHRRRLNLNDIDNLLKKIDLEENVPHFPKSQDAAKNEEELITKKTDWRCGDDVNTVPDYDTGMRNIMYVDVKKINRPLFKEFTKLTTTPITATSEYSPTDISTINESNSNNKSSSISSSESTQTTALHNTNNKASGDGRNNANNKNSNRDPQSIHSDALRMINLHKKTSMHQQKCTNDCVNENQNKQNLFSPIKEERFDHNKITSNLSLVSLTDLWSQNCSTNKYNMLQKLEEEKMRRQHCEQMIKQLQSRSLEFQERLAVALQVDQAKDDAIHRYHDAWEKIALKVQTLMEEKLQLENEIETNKVKANKDIEELNQKIQHYENEASKALNLAHVNQEKSTVLEHACADTKSKISLLESNHKELQQQYNCEIEKNKQLSELIQKKDIELNDNKNILYDAHKEISQSKKTVEMCQAELASLKAEYTKVEKTLSEERERISNLEKQKKKLLSDIESHKKIEKSLQDDVNKAKETNEQNKLELRNFYQDQVEAVVREKLQEFQLQLDKAESVLQEELRNRELSLAKKASEYIHSLSEKHNLEVQLIEEKHKEEIRLYHLQITQNQQQIENLQVKFQQQQERRTNIVQELRKVMEAQWVEAIRIINSSRSPVVSHSLDYNTLDQLNSLKSKSYINVEELLLNVKEDEKHSKQSGDESGKNIFQPIQRAESLSSIIEDDNAVKYSKQNTPIPADTPVTSRSQKNSRQQTEHDLQKFIHMLLNKSPGNPTEEQSAKNGNPHLRSIPTVDTERLTWQIPPTDDSKPTRGTSSKDRKSSKKPWK